MSPSVLGFAGLILVVGAMVPWLRRMRDVRIPENRTPFVTAWLAGAALGLASLVSGPGWPGGIAAALALVAGVFPSIFVAISAQQVAPNAIRVGGKLPDFGAPDETGARFEIASTVGKPLLLKFFRGHW